MENNNLEIKDLASGVIDELKPLVDQFVQSQKSIPFRDNYWELFQEWFTEVIDKDDAICLTAELNGRIAGFILGDIRDNVPILTPGQIGHVSVLIVDNDVRLNGIGSSLWDAMREWFILRGITAFELYTDYGNRVSGPFWQKRGFKTFVERRRFA